MFLYFDLGNVLLYFSHERSCRQMAEVAGIDHEAVRRALLDERLQWRYEAGELTTDAFYEAFCTATATRPPKDELLFAMADIFEINVSLIPIVSQLEVAGYRLGLLSNTCEAHWRHVSQGRYWMLPKILSAVTLSYEAHALKPDRAIYDYAAKKAGVPAADIIYIDDIAGHIEGALAAGFDGIQYTTTAQLAADLRRRGIRFNY